MLRRFWTWLIGPAQAPSQRVKDVEKRIAIVEDDMDWLLARWSKLQGRLTGGLRNTPTATEPDAPDPPGMPAGLDEISKRIWRRRLSNREESHAV